ncbi:MAG TPA: LPS assembly protein LptD, partial [Pseudomonadales bacterium]|nr:LPS assembly protein LptD [Pseudomonadales bacterium]
MSVQAENATTTAAPAAAATTDSVPEVPSLKKEPLDWVRTREYQKKKPAAPLPERLNFCRGLFVEPEIPPIPTTNGSNDNTHASADHYAFDPEGRSVLEGNVVIRRGDEQLESQKVYLYKQENRAQLEGDVQVRRPGILIVGERADIDMDKNTGVYYNTQYVFHARQLHGSADEIRSNEDGSLELQNGFFTSCEPGHENWDLTGSNIWLDKNSGWGTATNARLEVEGVPVFYTPYAKFPIDDRRHSGLLLPTFDSTTDGGFEYSQPIYLNLAPNYDATITPHFIEKRGNMLETEFRYLTDNFGRGEIGLADLPKDRVYDDKRHLFTWRHYDDQSSRWTSHVQYTYVSDPQYFEDLTTDLSTAALPQLERVGETEYRGDDWTFTGRLQGYQTIDQTISKTQLPYRRLPQLAADADIPSDVFNGWEYLLRTEYSYFDYPLEDQSVVTLAHRVRAEPGLRYRWEKPWGYVSPTAKVRYAAYKMYAEDGLEPDLNPTRTVPMFSLD